MAKYASQTTDARPVRRLLRRLIAAPAAWALIWPLLLFVGAYVAWHRWGAQRVASELQGVQPAQIRLSPRPEYIREDLVATVYRDTALKDLSLVDPKATAKIASAFAIHPWIREVSRVRKLPGGAVDVHAEYRRPVAMVLCQDTPEPGSRGTDSGHAYLPVDGEGIVLPTSDFAPAQTRDYIQIAIEGLSASQRLLGSRFGDRRVELAARLAAFLADYRDVARVESIRLSGDPRTAGQPQFELVTFDRRIHPWGSAPGHEMPQEATAEMKLKLLLEGTAAARQSRLAERPSMP